MHGFQVSTKTVVTSSSNELAQHIRQKLAAEGVSVQVAASGRDVGCDLTGGSRRRVSLQNYRLHRAKQGSKIVSALGKSGKDYKKLVFTGIRSRLFGVAVMGAAPTTTKRARTAICAPWDIESQEGALPLLWQCTLLFL